MDAPNSVLLDAGKAVRIRVLFSEDTRWPRNLVRWFGRTRRTHVHLEMGGCCLLGSTKGSGWYSIETAERLYRTTDAIDLGWWPVDHHLMILLMSGWHVKTDILGHIRWWFLGGPSPLNCVGLTLMALGHMGIRIDADTPDQLHESLQGRRAKDHP
jgi:hypothetical protein